ncbi:MAG: sigma-70 family RNA polymerase sigma factor [Asticcacaulis sp.]
MYDKRRLDVYLSHRSALIDYATPILGDRARAEDVVQEAWVRFSAVRGAAAALILRPENYLYRIVRNLAIDYSRHRARENWVGDDALSDVADSQARVAQAVEARDQIRAVNKALSELSDRHRQAFEMRRLQGMGYGEIGKVMGVSQTRAHDLVRQAYEHCVMRMMEDGHL